MLGVPPAPAKNLISNLTSFVFSQNSVSIVRLSGAFCVDSASFHTTIYPGVDVWPKTKFKKNKLSKKC